MAMPVASVNQCKFEFASRETVRKTDNYRGCRYRFNKWREISDYYPDVVRDGLVFQQDRWDPLGGIQSTWSTPAGSNATVSAYFHDHEMEVSGAKATIGAGIITQHAPWWDPFQAIEFGVERTIGGPTLLTYYRRNPTTFEREDMQLYTVDNRAFDYTITLLGSTAGITYQEYDFDGQPSYNWTYNHDSLNDNKRKFIFYHKVDDAVASIRLVKTVISAPAATIAPTESVWFQDNPSKYINPIGPPRDFTSALYPLPHIAYLEDGEIKLEAPECSRGWYKLLAYLTYNTIEPFKFTDIHGTTFLCCFDQLSGGARKLKGQTAYGYDLLMRPLVIY